MEGEKRSNERGSGRSKTASGRGEEKDHCPSSVLLLSYFPAINTIVA